MRLHRAFFLAFLITFLFWNTTACQSATKSSISDLLIELSVFPAGWQVSQDGPGKIPSAPLGGNDSVESIELEFRVYGGGAIESIRRFKNVEDAEAEFIHQKAHIFRKTDFTTPWEVPSEVVIDKINADQYYFACSQSVGSYWPGCEFIAQYGVYFVDFSTGMYTDYMSYKDLSKIIQAIDDLMQK